MEIVGKIFNWYTQAMDASVLDVRSVGIDLLFLSVFTAVGCIVIGYLVRKISGKKVFKYTVLSISGVMAVCMEYVMRNLPYCVLRIKEILDNVKYIMSYESNLKSFLAALGLTSEYSSKIDTIIYYMNRTEWEKAESGTGYMSWYMKGIHRSLNRTVRVFGYHLGRPGYEQGKYFFIAAITISLFYVIVFYKTFLMCMDSIWRKLLTVILFAGSLALCEALCFGTTFYLISTVIVILLLQYSLTSLKKIMGMEKRERR